VRNAPLPPVSPDAASKALAKSIDQISGMQPRYRG
jgi:hypothetical protein